jgi:serine/threonine protein kinase, bacterial
MRLASRKAPPLELEAGTVVGGYSIEGFTGRHVGPELICDAIGPNGESASVVMARIPPADRRTWAELRLRGRLRARLRHPALLPVYALGDFAGRPYMVMDSYSDATFADLIGSAMRRPAEVLELLRPVCEALDLAHEEGLVHQSLSSTSLLVEEGGLFLDSFGVVGWPPQPTFESLGYRDTRYASPEEFAGAVLEPPSNVYSMACLLLESVSTRERSRITRAHVQLLEPSPGAGEEGQPSGSAFDRVIARGVASNPGQRQRTVSELLNEAAAALGVEFRAPAPVKRPPSISLEASPEERARPRRGRAAVAAIATVLALATVGGAVTAAILEPFDDGGDAQSAQSADVSALRRLADRRAELRDGLAAAATPQEQSELAAQLAASYREAARDIGSGPVASAARAASAAYADLAAAAESGDGAAFVEASRAVDGAEERVMSVTARH